MPMLDWRCGSEDQGLRVQEALGSVPGTPRKKVEPILRVPNSLPSCSEDGTQVHTPPLSTMLPLLFPLSLTHSVSSGPQVPTLSVHSFMSISDQ